MIALTLVTAPTTEPVTAAEVKTHCKIDASNQELAPGAPTVALASPAVAGSVTAGAHRYRVTFVTADGETEGGTVSSSVTVADAAVNGKIELTAIPLGGALVTSRKIYRTAAGGSTYLLLATLSDNTTTVYTDNIADASLGAGAPSTNSTTDPEIAAMIKAARGAAEGKTRSALVTQTWDMVLDGFPDWEMHIPKNPLQSVTSITYVDTDGATQTLSSSLYRADTANTPARITPAYGQVWPSTRSQTGAVTVRFVCGYGAASAVPQAVKLWILTRVKHYYDNRGTEGSSSATEFPRSYVDGLLDDHTFQSFAWA